MTSKAHANENYILGSRRS